MKHISTTESPTDKTDVLSIATPVAICDYRGRVEYFNEVMHERHADLLSAPFSMGRVRSGRYETNNAVFLTTPIKLSDNRDGFILIGSTSTTHTTIPVQTSEFYRMDLLDSLVRGFIHDINNQLTTILGFSEILASEQSKQDSSEEYANITLQAANRARGLVEELTSIVKDTGETFARINLTTFLKGIIAKYNNTLAEGIKIRKNLEITQAAIELQPISANRLFIDLLDMLCDYLVQFEGGDIIITVKPSDISRSAYIIELAVLPRADAAVVSSAHQQLNEKLQILRTKRLPSSWSLATQVDLENRLVVELLTNKSEHSSTESEIGDWFTLPASNKTIYVIDDDELVLKTLRNLLVHLGYHVRLFHDPNELFQSIENTHNEPDLLITDLHMPKLNGIELVQQLRKIRKSMPIIVFSAYISDNQIEEALQHGANQVMKKPINKTELAKHIEELTRV